MIARVTVSGDAVRIRLDNTFGTTPLTVGKAYVGQRIQRAALAAGSNRQVLFNASARVIVPPRGSVTSDPVRDARAGAAGPRGHAVHPRRRRAAQPARRRAGDVLRGGQWSGDVAAEEAATPFTGTTHVDVVAEGHRRVSTSSSTGAIVAFGDSITDGTCTTVDAHDRWEDLLAVRLALDAANLGRRDAHKAVVNEGIGGNTVTGEKLQPPPDSPPGVERLDRDVLSHSGVTHVIFFMGTNDIRREAPAAQVIAGMQNMSPRG